VGGSIGWKIKQEWGGRVGLAERLMVTGVVNGGGDNSIRSLCF